ncbi:hypothetical protein FAM09_18225 [Niastella caeni]|uniref:Uncharacterized protein n=1 Tax=Niastella caeni TaxID=2569763 RepID=A0A4S8HNE8_9BACT|nr:hypothetical protein [Niastella caeni]THU36900.1 hypothetical protein FAM09_18225 [Niastella caeni]
MTQTLLQKKEKTYYKNGSIMNVFTRKEISIVSHVISRAQNEIQQQAGIEVTLIPRYSNKMVENDLKKLFEAMCDCWNVQLAWVSDKSRANDRPSMRKLLWMVGKKKFPHVPYCLLASLTGTTDHAGVIKGIRSGYNWLNVQDEKFLKYYEPVKSYFDEYQEEQV